MICCSPSRRQDHQITCSEFAPEEESSLQQRLIPQYIAEVRELEKEVTRTYAAIHTIKTELDKIQRERHLLLQQLMTLKEHKRQQDDLAEKSRADRVVQQIEWEIAQAKAIKQ